MLAHPWTAAAFTSSAYGYPAGSYGYKYMRRLVGHLRQSDKGKSNHEAWWNQMHDVPAPPPRSTASMADGSSQDAAAEARLAEMLGCAPPHSSRSRAAAEETPHDGDCDVNLMMKLEEWGLPHDFTVRAFKTFPFNHASASYAILEGKMLAQRECVALPLLKLLRCGSLPRSWADGWSAARVQAGDAAVDGAE